MTIACQVLGAPGRDNALMVRVDSGQSVHSLLFDCGEGCLSSFGLGDILGVDGLFFSHLHMDHVAGFDSFFRCVFNRTSKPNAIWGPPGTAEAMHHRFRGFLWNLVEGVPGTWRVSDVFEDRVEPSRFELSESFASRCPEPPVPREGAALLREDAFEVDCLQMDHGTPSLAYVVREAPKRNIDMGKLAGLGLKPGPWMQALKGGGDPASTVQAGGKEWRLGELREALLVETPGDSVAYLTDFLLDEAAADRLAPALRGVGTIVCEAQYRDGDEELALRNRHMTVSRAANLAKRAEAGALILFHLSDRYRPSEWLEMLQAARSIFPRASFPAHWNLREAPAAGEAAP